MLSGPDLGLCGSLGVLVVPVLILSATGSHSLQGSQVLCRDPALEDEPLSLENYGVFHSYSIHLLLSILEA